MSFLKMINCMMNIAPVCEFPLLVFLFGMPSLIMVLNISSLPIIIYLLLLLLFIIIIIINLFRVDI